MRFVPSLMGLAALAVPSLASAADAPKGLILDARLRYETVAQDGLSKDAQAVTLRTRLGYETPAFHGFKVLVEGENVTALSDRYNSSTNGKTAYPLVTDPETTELNRAQVSWTGTHGEAVVGRQRLILNNARFVGNVGFRQNEQTFDAAKLVYRPSPTVSVTYAYIDKVHRIFGEDRPWPGLGLWLPAGLRQRADPVERHLGRAPDGRPAAEGRHQRHLRSRVRPPDRLPQQPHQL